MSDRSKLALRHTFGAYPTGIALVAAQVGGRPSGMLANSFTSISLDPPLVAVSFAHTSTTWPTLSQAVHLGISILADGDIERASLLRRPAVERFEGIDLAKVDGGALVIPDTAATLIVRRHSVAEAGDHVIALFQVVDHHRDDTAMPLVFHGGRFGTLTASGDAPSIHEGGM